MSFLHGTSVSSGVSLIIQSGVQGDPGNVEIESPSLFHADVTLSYGQLELEVLHGTSYSLANDMLSIFNGKVVETLHLTPLSSTVHGGTPEAILVSQTSGGISIHADGSDYTGGGHLLPLHVGSEAAWGSNAGLLVDQACSTSGHQISPTMAPLRATRWLPSRPLRWPASVSTAGTLQSAP
jgi:hypothetical protein